MLQWVKVFSFWLYNKEGAAQPHYMTEDNATTSWACVQSPVRLWLLAKDLQVETPVTNESNTWLLIWAKQISHFNVINFILQTLTILWKFKPSKLSSNKTTKTNRLFLSFCFKSSWRRTCKVTSDRLSNALLQGLFLSTVTLLAKEQSHESIQFPEELGSQHPHADAKTKQELTLPTSDETKYKTKWHHYTDHTVMEMYSFWLAQCCKKVSFNTTAVTIIITLTPIYFHLFFFFF